MADETFTTKDNGALWLQPGGPNTKPYYLGCHDLGDISAPEGGITLIQCFDGKGGWRTLGHTEEAPGPITFNLGTYVGKTLEWIEKIRCRAPLYVHLRDCGRPDQFGNFTRSLILDLAKITSRSYTGLVNKAESQVAMATVEAAARPPIVHVFQLKAVRQSIAETTDLFDVAFCNDPRCAGPCGGQQEEGQVGFLVGEALSGSPANQAEAWFTEDGGGAWTAGAAQPFAGGEDIGAAVCFYVGRNTIRRLVVRGETDLGNPAEVAYSDDDGATWTQVNVGSVNGQYAVDSGALFALDQYHIWLVTDGGYIYFSDDGGETWDAQEEGIISIEDLHAVHFANELVGYAVGDNNVVLKTVDGGVTWSAVTGPASGVNLTTVNVRGQNLVWVGTADGKLYYSNDEGDSWTQRAFAGDGAGEVADIAFANDYVGFMLHNTAAPVGTVHMTINGGYSWEALTTPTNGGLNAIAAVNERLAYAVGNAQGGTGVVLKISGG